MGKRRTWRKLHVGVNEATGEICAALVSTHDLSDDEALADLLDQVEAELEQGSGDGAYDKRKCYDAIEARGATPVIPPRRDAVLWSEAEEGRSEPHPCHQAIERIEAVGRKVWKQESTITDVPWLRRQCIGSRPSLEERCVGADLPTRQSRSFSSVQR